MSTPVRLQATPDDTGENVRTFWSVLESSPDGFTIFQPVLDEQGSVEDFVYWYVNPAGAAMVELTPAELIGQRMRVMFPGVVETGILAGYTLAYHRNTPWQHELLYDRDGLATGFRLVAVRSDRFLIVSYSDITARVRAERERDQLLERAAQLQTVTSALATAVTEDAVAQLAADLVRRLVGARYVSILVAETTEASLRLLLTDHLPPSVVSAVARIPVHTEWPAPTAFRTGRAIVETGRADILRQYPEVATLANLFEVEATVAVPLRWNDQAFGVMAFDFTEAVSREKLEAMLPLLSAIAEQCMRALDRARLLTREREARLEVEAALNAVARTSQEKSAFLAEMSHEVRTPLQSMRAYTDLLLHEAMGPLTDRQRETLQKLQRGADRIRRLADDVLEFSQLESGRLEMTLEPVPLRDALSATEALISPHLDAAELTLSIDDQLDKGTLSQADPHHLLQILLNLLTNAIKHTPAGGRVTVRLRHAVIAEDRVQRLLIEVQDSGRGIPAAQLEAIFEPFVQVHRERAGELRASGTAHGVGLGLTISRQLARGMGGDLLASSTLGEGATFALILLRAASA